MDLSQFTPSVSLDLTEKDVKAILKDALKDQMPGFVVEDVVFSTSTEYDMRGESCGTKFGGAKIKFSRVSSPLEKGGYDTSDAFVEKGGYNPSEILGL